MSRPYINFHTRNIFINVELKNEVNDIAPLFPKLCIVLNFKVLTLTVQHSASRILRPGFRVQHPESKVQRPGSIVQIPASRAQRPASGVQGQESSIQSPASRAQRPESSVQLFRPESRNFGMPFNIVHFPNFEINASL